MGVMSGNVNLTVRVEGAGDGPKRVDETKKSVDKLTESTEKASEKTSSLKDRIGALKTGVGPVNLLREGFNFLKENVGFVSIATGAATAAFEVLWDVFAGSPVNELVDEIRAASTASIQLAKNTQILGRSASETQGLIRGLSQSVYQLAASNAEASGDMARAGFLRRFAGLKVVDDQLKDAKDAVAALEQEDNKLSGILGDAERRRYQIRADMQTSRQEFEAGRLSDEDYGKTIATLTTDLGLWGIREKQARDRAVDVNKELIRRKALVDELGVSLENAADATIKLDALIVEPEKRGGGAARREVPVGPGMFEGYGDRRGHLIGQDDINAEMVPDFVARPDSYYDDAIRSGARQNKRGNNNRGMLPSGIAEDVRDFSSSLSDSIPQLSEFQGALREVAGAWGDVAAANDNAADVYGKYLEGKATEAEYLKAVGEARKAETRGLIQSVGASAMAGAEKIKNERLRAGVLATIHLGLGTALMFVPGAQAEAAGHLAGAAILGSVAIFGGSSSSGRKSSSSTRSVSRPLSERTASGAINITINGPWIGATSPQETAAAMHSMQRRGTSSGYVPRAAA